MNELQAELRSLGIHLKPAFVQGVLDSAGATGLAREAQVEVVFTHFLDCDLRAAGAGCLPHTLPEGPLSGKMALQVDEFWNVGVPAKERFSMDRPKRLLKLQLSDGCQTVGAVELRLVPAFGEQLKAGCKIAVLSPELERGLLLLRPENVQVLGGQVRALEEARQRVMKRWRELTAGGYVRRGAARPDLYAEARAAAQAPAGEAGDAAPPAPVAAHPPHALLPPPHPPGGPPAHQPQQPSQRPPQQPHFAHPPHAPATDAAQLHPQQQQQQQLQHPQQQLLQQQSPRQGPGLAPGFHAPAGLAGQAAPPGSPGSGLAGPSGPALTGSQAAAAAAPGPRQLALPVGHSQPAPAAAPALGPAASPAARREPDIIELVDSPELPQRAPEPEDKRPAGGQPSDGAGRASTSPAAGSLPWLSDPLSSSPASRKRSRDEVDWAGAREWQEEEVGGAGEDDGELHFQWGSAGAAPRGLGARRVLGDEGTQSPRGPPRGSPGRLEWDGCLSEAGDEAPAADVAEADEYGGPEGDEEPLQEWGDDHQGEWEGGHEGQWDDGQQEGGWVDEQGAEQGPELQPEQHETQEPAAVTLPATAAEGGQEAQGRGDPPGEGGSHDSTGTTAHGGSPQAAPDNAWVAGGRALLEEPPPNATLRAIQAHTEEASPADFPFSATVTARLKRVQGRLEYEDPVTREPLERFQLRVIAEDATLEAALDVSHELVEARLGLTPRQLQERVQSDIAAARAQLQNIRGFLTDFTGSLTLTIREDTVAEIVSWHRHNVDTL